MLLKLLEYVKEKQCVSIQQLSREFRSDEQALLPMLEKWILKGKIRSYQQASQCKSRCASACRKSDLIYYEFISVSQSVSGPH